MKNFKDELKALIFFLSWGGIDSILRYSTSEKTINLNQSFQQNFPNWKIKMWTVFITILMSYPSLAFILGYKSIENFDAFMSFWNDENNGNKSHKRKVSHEECWILAKIDLFFFFNFKLKINVGKLYVAFSFWIIEILRKSCRSD